MMIFSNLFKQQKITNLSSHSFSYWGGNSCDKNNEVEQIYLSPSSSAAVFVNGRFPSFQS